MTTVMAKRPAQDPGQDAVVKRMKTDSTAISTMNPARTSSLMAPSLLLSGHSAGVNANRFNGDGSVLASGSFDKQIFLWRTSDECPNFMALKGHQGSVLDLAWSSDSARIYSVASDKVITIWDVEVGVQVKKLRTHKSFVNACSASRANPNYFLTGGDDATVLFWDGRARDAQAQINLDLPITSLALSKDDLTAFVGGVDSMVTGWDLRSIGLTLELAGAQEMATGLSLSPDGAHLLVNSMDNTLRCYDVRPYCPGRRLTRSYFGATHDFEKNLLRCSWSGDGSQIAAGSADRMVHVWDVATGRIIYKLPGHKGSVNDVAFHPSQPIVASASSDETIFIGELN